MPIFKWNVGCKPCQVIETCNLCDPLVIPQTLGIRVVGAANYDPGACYDCVTRYTNQFALPKIPVADCAWSISNGPISERLSGPVPFFGYTCAFQPFGDDYWPETHITVSLSKGGLPSDPILLTVTILWVSQFAASPTVGDTENRWVIWQKNFGLVKPDCSSWNAFDLGLPIGWYEGPAGGVLPCDWTNSTVEVTAL